MKKLFLSLIALVALVSVSCGGETALYKELNQLVSTSHAAIEAAETAEEVDQIVIEFGQKSTELATAAEAKGESITQDELTQFQLSSLELGQAGAAKKTELAGGAQ